jgi:viroplasmin and RNaseH domain-containing protein
MQYKFQNKLLQKAEELTNSLKSQGICADIDRGSLRDYNIKISLSVDDRSFGKANIYYSPRKDSYSLKLHELKDESIVPKLEEIWENLSNIHEDVKSHLHTIYVDGSFINGSVGYGVVILKDNEVIEELFGSIPDELASDTWQVAGEIFATEQAVKWCQRNSIEEVNIFYDYIGIEKWATGKWQTKQNITNDYAHFMRNCGVRIHWHKVNSHTGVRWNERADELAKKGANSALPEGNADGKLENIAEGFAHFLRENGYDANVKGFYNNSRCAKIEISEENMQLGYLNIYHTKKIPFLIRYHELKDGNFEGKFDALWRNYLSKGSQLEFKFDQR